MDGWITWILEELVKSLYVYTSNQSFCLSQLETNVKLEECLTKVQQENEDYKARMDKHAALSKYVLQLQRLQSHRLLLQQDC